VRLVERGGQRRAHEIANERQRQLIRAPRSGDEQWAGRPLGHGPEMDRPDLVITSVDLSGRRAEKAGASEPDQADDDHPGDEAGTEPTL